MTAATREWMEEQIYSVVLLDALIAFLIATTAKTIAYSLITDRFNREKKEQMPEEKVK